MYKSHRGGVERFVGPLGPGQQLIFMQLPLGSAPKVLCSHQDSKTIQFLRVQARKDLTCFQARRSIGPQQ